MMKRWYRAIRDALREALHFQHKWMQDGSTGYDFCIECGETRKTKY